MTEALGQNRIEAPEPTVETAAYWEAARGGRLVIGRCANCDSVHFYPRRRCPTCLGATTEFIPASGRGVLYSYSVMRRVEAPYAIAYVALEEGVTMMSNVIGCAPEDLKIGMALEVTFAKAENGQAVPMFKPA